MVLSAEISPITKHVSFTVCWKKKKPDVIVMLTSFYILDRAIILSARALEYKNGFLMPGIREVDTDYIKTTEYETKF